MNSRRSNPGKGVLVLTAGIVLAALLAMHELVPATNGAALIVDSLLPWTWILVALLAIVGLIRFSLFSIVGILVPALVWGSMFLPYLKPADSPDGRPDLLVASQNVGARLPQPTATAQQILEAGPDIVTVQEIESLSGQIIVDQLNSSFAHSEVQDSIGVWSKWPMTAPEEIDLGLPWPRAFATTVQTDHGDVRFYAVHLPSVRPGEESMRNAALRTLARTAKADPAERVIIAGDFNSAATDRNFSEIESGFSDTRREVGGGFGFTWPSILPVTRLDHIMVRGLDPVSDEVLGRGTSDHRAIVAGLDVG